MPIHRGHYRSGQHLLTVQGGGWPLPPLIHTTATILQSRHYSLVLFCKIKIEKFMNMPKVAQIQRADWEIQTI